MKSFAYLIAIAAFVALPAHASTITISFSEDFQETLEDDYGLRESDTLREFVTEDLEEAFTKAGVDPDQVDVTIINAKPNRPTFEQARNEPSLDTFRSFSIGGMEVEGTAFDADGNTLGNVSYRWFENDIRESRFKATWTDANRASRQFARRLAKDISE